MKKGRMAFIPCLMVVAAAFALRTCRLGGQSLWGDEAWSVFFAQQGWPQMLDWLIADSHPPLYFVLLKLWLPLAGASEFALRFPSLFFSVTSVGLLFTLGNRLLGPRVGLLAALLLAFSAFDLYLAQEARMYTLLALLVLLSTYLLLKAIEGSRHLLPLCGLVVAAALYTHYFALFSLGAQAIFVAFFNRGSGGALGESSLEEKRRTRLRPLLALGLALVSYLPWVLAFAASPSSREALDPSRLAPARLWQSVSAIWRAFAAGTTLEPDFSLLVAGLLLPWLAVGVAYAWRGQKGSALLGLSLALPVLGVLASLAYIPYFFPRYLLFVLWAYLLFLAAGLTALGRWHWAWALVPLSIFLSANGWSAKNLYLEEAYAKGGYRSMMTYLKSHISKDEAVVLNTHNQVPIFSYYSGGLPYRVVQPTAGVEVERELEEAARGQRGLWLVLFGNVARYDPRQEVPGWLARGAFFGGDVGFGDARLAYFSLPQGGEGPYHPLGDFFGGLLGLEGYRLEPARLKGGESLRLSLFWRARATVDKDYTVFVHLLDGQRRQISGVDSQPQAGLAPTRSWRPGQLVEDRYSLPVPSQAAAGLYYIEVGLYGGDGQRLSLEGGQGSSILLGPVEVW